MLIGYINVYRSPTSKISNPAISRTPMKNCLLFLVSRVLLIRATNHLNRRSYTDLARALTALVTWFLFCPLVTYSLPTLTLGESIAFNMSEQLTPMRKAARSASAVPSASACSSRGLDG